MMGGSRKIEGRDICNQNMFYNTLIELLKKMYKSICVISLITYLRK